MEKAFFYSNPSSSRGISKDDPRWMQFDDFAIRKQCDFHGTDLLFARPLQVT
jgi:hypothetical protein